MKKPTRVVERAFWADGLLAVAGVDEVGRGAWAGPVTAAAVILPQRCSLNGVRDSKLLTALQREQWAKLIKRKALAVGIGWSQPEHVDQEGLTAAVKQSARRALHKIQAEAVILDGKHDFLAGEFRTKVIIKADQSSLCVAAASIVAKVARDRYMQLLGQRHPLYGFDSNKGYGSAVHLRALKTHGLSPVHRRRWRPVAATSQLEMQFMELIGVD